MGRRDRNIQQHLLALPPSFCPISSEPASPPAASRAGLAAHPHARGARGAGKAVGRLPGTADPFLGEGEMLLECCRDLQRWKRARSTHGRAEPPRDALPGSASASAAPQGEKGHAAAMGLLPPALPCSKVTLSGTPAWQRDLLPAPSLPSPSALVKDSSCPRRARARRHTGQPCHLPSPLVAVLSAVWWELSKQCRARVNLRVVGRGEQVPA